MYITCPSCKAQNRDEARYCDQCGAPLTEDAVAQTAASEAPPAVTAGGRRQAVNWLALLLVVAAIGVVGWLLLMPKGGGNGQGSATMGAGASSANPHAEAAANPEMGKMMAGLDEAKKKIEKDPLDVEALTTLYQTYGMIGRQEKIRPYLEKALAELKAKKATLGDKAQQTASDIASAAIAGQDLPGALEALTLLNEMAPDKLPVMSLIGDINYDMGNVDKAIEWYDKYLKKATPEAQGEDYWMVRVDRAAMLLQSGETGSKPELKKQAVTELEQVTVAQPKMYKAWFNLGQAYDKSGDKAKAKSAWQKSLALAKDANEKWQAEAQLARLEGKEPPPPPASPHGEGRGGGGMGAEGMGGMPNPHGAGGADSGAGGMPNPHGAGGTGSEGGGTTNPHGGG